MKILKIIGIIVIILLSIYAIILRVNEKQIDYTEENYTVKSGDTLWSIAKEYANEHEDLREYIYKIKKVNNITSNLEVGQTIKIYR